MILILYNVSLSCSKCSIIIDVLMFVYLKAHKIILTELEIIVFYFQSFTRINSGIGMNSISNIDFIRARRLSS